MSKGTDERYAGRLERLRNFRLLGDTFMTKCFESGPACVELVLRILLDKPDLKVVDVRTQQFVENRFSRSVRLDILMFEEGKLPLEDISRYARTSLKQGKRIRNECLV